jgi:hypothetical protein
MKISTFFLIAIITALNLSACGSESKAEKTESIEEQKSEVGFSDFLDEILLGFEISAIHKHMVHTPYSFLGETELLLNFEGQDENLVKHFVSFHKHKDDANQMSALVYNIDFRSNNSNLVKEYQERLIAQLDQVYGEWSDDFQTGYNTDGNYEAEWLFEAGVLLVTVGTDFIIVDLREH